MVNFNSLSLIVDATNRPSFYGYGGYDVPPLTLGLSSYFGFSPLSPPSSGWHVPALWGWGTPMSRFGESWYGYDLFDAGARLLNWGNALTETDPFLHPYVWNSLMWRNYFPYGLPFPWIPPPVPYNPWPAQQSYGGQAPISAPSSHVEMNGRGAQPPPTEDYLEPPPSGAETPPLPLPSGRPGRRGATHRPSESRRSEERASGGGNLSWSEFQTNPNIQQQIKRQLGEGTFTNANGMVVFTRRSDGKAFYFPKQGNEINAAEIDF